MKLFSLFRVLCVLALIQAATCTIYLVPGLHSQHERYGIIAREQPPSGSTGALRKIKSSRVDVVRLPLSKVISQIQDKAVEERRVVDLRQGGTHTKEKEKKKMNAVDDKLVNRCSSLLGPFCFQSFTEGLNIAQYEPKIPQQGVFEVTPESLQLAILSSPGDVLVFLYKGHQPDGLSLRKAFVKAGVYLQGQIDILAMDCGGNFRHPTRQGKAPTTTTTSSYCAELEAPSHGMLKHFRRLSDNIYTIHSKSVLGHGDITIHASIEFLRSPKMQVAATGTGGEQQQQQGGGEDPRRKHANKRMLVIRNQSSFSVTISWEMEEGKERLYYELTPSQSQLVNGFVSQKWNIREKNSKALIKQIEIKNDLSLGGVSLHVINNDMIKKTQQGATI